MLILFVKSPPPRVRVSHTHTQAFMSYCLINSANLLPSLLKSKNAALII